MIQWNKEQRKDSLELGSCLYQGDADCDADCEVCDYQGPLQGHMEEEYEYDDDDEYNDDGDGDATYEYEYDDGYQPSIDMEDII